MSTFSPPLSYSRFRFKGLPACQLANSHLGSLVYLPEVCKNARSTKQCSDFQDCLHTCAPVGRTQPWSSCRVCRAVCSGASPSRTRQHLCLGHLVSAVAPPLPGAAVACVCVSVADHQRGTRADRVPAPRLAVCCCHWNSRTLDQNHHRSANAWRFAARSLPSPLQYRWCVWKFRIYSRLEPFLSTHSTQCFMSGPGGHICRPTGMHFLTLLPATFSNLSASSTGYELVRSGKLSRRLTRRCANGASVMPSRPSTTQRLALRFFHVFVLNVGKNITALDI